MGSVLIMRPSNWGLAERLAFEGTITRVLDQKNLNGENPKRIGSIKMAEQFDFCLAGDNAQAPEVHSCMEKAPVLGSGAFHEKLVTNFEYLQGVVNLCDAKSIADADLNSLEGEGLTIDVWVSSNQEFLYIGYFVDYIRMCEGERGPLTSGMGHVLWKANPNDQLIESFIPLKKLLIDLNFMGPITIGAFVTEQEVYFGGIRACIDHRHLLWHELAPKGLYNMLLGLSVDSEVPRILNDYAIGVCCMSLASGDEYRPVYNNNEGSSKHFFGNTATARGETISETRKRVYRTLKTVTCLDPEIFFRNDIGAGVEAKIGRLKMWGWLNA